MTDARARERRWRALRELNDEAFLWRLDPVVGSGPVVARATEALAAGVELASVLDLAVLYRDAQSWELLPRLEALFVEQTGQGFPDNGELQYRALNALSRHVLDEFVTPREMAAWGYRQFCLLGDDADVALWKLFDLDNEYDKLEWAGGRRTRADMDREVRGFAEWVLSFG